MPGDLGEAVEDLLKEPIEPQERAREKGEIADGEFASNGAPDDEGIGGIIGEGGDGGEDGAQAGAQNGDAAVF